MNQPAVSNTFRPRLWLRNGHAQTLWRKFSPAPTVKLQRQRVELSDGDFVDLDWHQTTAASDAAERTIVLLLHGLCGCSRSRYIQSLQYRLGLSGYRSVAMNFRGCSGEINRLAKAYHSGVSEDLGEVIDVLSRQNPDSEFVVVGFSLGANVLLKWLGEIRVNSSVRRAVAVSTPFNLVLCSQAMLEGLSRVYGRYFLKRLVADVEKKKLAFQQSGNHEQLELLRSCGDLSKLNSLWEFDDRVTAPLHGFDDAHHYYAQCSSLGYLADISVPTLLLQSLDDPIIPPRALPGEEHLGTPLVLDFLDRGGHVGFASATDRFWLEDRIVNFVSG